jgi:iron(III) transport system substrate-binding protein
MFHVTRRGAGLALTVLTLCLAGASPSRAAEEVNVYNARHYGTDRILWDGFERATGIKVNVISGNHDELIQRIQSEGAASPADVFITVDAGRLAFAAEKGLLQPVHSEILERVVPAHLRHPDGLWFGLAVRARVLVYAKDRVDPAMLSTYEALAEPAYKGRIVVRSSTSVYNLSLVGALIQAHGEAWTERWCEGLVSNMARPPEGGDGDQLKAVAAGVGDIAISNTYYFARMLASDKPEERAVAEKLAVFFPNQNDRGTHVNVSGGGVVATAPHRGNAVRFLEYLVTPEAQRYFADVSMEYPVNPEVKPHPVLAAWGPFKQDQLNAADYAANSAAAARLTDRCGWR